MKLTTLVSIMPVWILSGFSFFVATLPIVQWFAAFGAVVYTVYKFAKDSKK